MPYHRVSQGDCLSSIAEAHGFAELAAIWDHPENQALKEARKTPNVLLPGDRVFVPEREDKAEPGATGAVHRFRIKRPRTKLRVVVRDRDRQTIPDSEYVLEVGGREIKGTTSGGLVEQDVPASAATAALWIPALGVLLHLDLGHLDPHDAVSGAQARLNNLRYGAGAVDGELGPRTRAALRAFQHDQGIDESGELDEATRDALRAEHGS